MMMLNPVPEKGADREDVDLVTDQHDKWTDKNKNLHQCVEGTWARRGCFDHYDYMECCSRHWC